MRILLVDSHTMFLEGLAALLQAEEEFTLVGQATDGLAAIRIAEQERPDVVITELHVPSLNGVELTRELTAINPAVKVIALSAQSDRSGIVRMVEAGAMGYVLKMSSFSTLHAALHAVAAGKHYICPTIAHDLCFNMIKNGQNDGHINLSARQCRVLQLMAEGKSTKDISEILFVSVKTVEAHRRQIMERLEIRSIAELTKFAIREGLTGLE